MVLLVLQSIVYVLVLLVLQSIVYVLCCVLLSGGLPCAKDVRWLHLHAVWDTRTLYLILNYCSFYPRIAGLSCIPQITVDWLAVC